MLLSRISSTVALACLTLAAPAFAQSDNPVADPKATVVVGQARFTVLTPRLVRMEWSANGKFEDQASLVFINRRMPVPAYTVKQAGGRTVIDTGELQVRYRKAGGPKGKFAPDTLSVQLTLNGKTVTWKPGTKDAGNLQGTWRTLDGVKGASNLEPGLISKDGWVVVDDTTRPLFDQSDWPWVQQRPAGDRQDLYFFGYGHDYKAALHDYTLVAGRIPMPPRFAFGTWWSRYWSYTDREFKELVDEFKSHDVPLDVLVIDMDWHLTFGTKWWENKKDQSGHSLGWTGYTWNTSLFPSPQGFLSWVGQQGLKKTLNMHPASGVQPHEEQYPEMAKAMGIDPATQKYVPFDITDKKFAANYMNILHHPLEKQGVDFFWLDWQQETSTKVAGLNPTWWLNYVHTSDMERRGLRPLIFHRWGGLGNHRYQIGFSGDTVSEWVSLAFQPYFTATAANVGYGYWSHDIGGHLPGPVQPELYTRWIQYGLFSPILRTHTTKDPNAERRIWAYPQQYAAVMRDAFLLRYALIPYLYTASRVAYDTGLSLCRPLYYDYPEVPEAYSASDEYLFGADMIVAPITEPVAADTAMATRKIWLPAGEWVEWFTGSRFTGPVSLERSFTLDEIPVYVRAGAIVPMQPKMQRSNERPVDPLILTIFPGRSGSTRIYEDAGEGLGYKSNEFGWTTVRHAEQADGTHTIEVLPVEGKFAGMVTSRGYQVRLPGALPPGRIMYKGKIVPWGDGDGCDTNAPCRRYDGRTLTTIISLPKTPVTEGVTLTLEMPRLTLEQAKLVDGYAGTITRLQNAMDALNNTWPKGWSPDILVDAIQTASRIDQPHVNFDAYKVLAELQKLAAMRPQIVKEIKAADVEEKDRNAALKRMGM